MLTRAVIILLILQVATNSNAQRNANQLFGVWIKKGSVPDNIVEEPFTDSKFIRYDFRPNGLVYYSNCYLERGVPSKYRITEDNKLSLNFTFYRIVSINSSDLVISDDQDNVIHLIRVSQLRGDKKDSLSTSTITYEANFDLHPTLNANIDLYNYFFSINEFLDQLVATHNITDAISVLEYNSGSTIDDILVRLNFTVTKKGYVENVKVLQSTNPKKEPYYISKLVRTSGNWTPAKLNGGSVDSEIVLEFRKMGTKTIEKLNKADILFNKAKSHFQNGKYEKAMELINEALTINPTSQRYFLGRAYTYFALGNNRLGCEDLERVVDMNNDEVNKLRSEKCER